MIHEACQKLFDPRAVQNIVRKMGEGAGAQEVFDGGYMVMTITSIGSWTGEPLPIVKASQISRSRWNQFSSNGQQATGITQWEQASIYLALSRMILAVQPFSYDVGYSPVAMNRSRAVESLLRQIYWPYNAFSCNNDTWRCLCQTTASSWN